MEKINGVTDKLTQLKNVFRKLKQIKEIRNVKYSTIIGELLKSKIKLMKKNEQPEVNLNDYLYECVKNSLDKPWATWGSKSITYQELFENIEKVAKALKVNGVEEGDVVSVGLPTSPESIYTLLALLKIGAVAHEIDVDSNKKTYEAYIRRSKPKMIIVNENNYDKTVEIAKELGIEKIIYSSLKDSLTEGKTFEAEFPFIKADFALAPMENFEPNDELGLSFNDFVDSGRHYKGTLDVPYQKDRLAVKVQTGGTTGISKTANISNDNLISIAHRYDLALPIKTDGIKLLGHLPQFIITGIATGSILPISQRWVTQLCPTYDPEYIVPMFNRYKPNMFAGAKAYQNRLGDAAEKGEVDLSESFQIISAGDKINEQEQLSKSISMQKAGYPYGINVAYGLTEVASLATMTDTMKFKPGTVGTPVPQTPVEVFDPETDKMLPRGTVGEIRIGGKGVMLGYDDEEETKKVIWTDKDGNRWVKTGDIGRIMKNDDVYVIDRMKNIIHVVGYNVYPETTENELLNGSDGAIGMCKVVGKDSKEFGQVPVAHIQLNPEFQGNEGKIEGKLVEALENSTLSRAAYPVEYFFWDRLPVTDGASKIDPKALQAAITAESIEEIPSKCGGNKVLHKYIPNAV